jgi:DNA adenine methylase
MAAEPRPFLKWAGGKGQLLSKLTTRVPRSFHRYFEPFLGGAAVFFALRPRCAVLADINAELIDCYTAVRDQVDQVIAALQGHRYDSSYFYRVRGIDPASLSPPERAARTIFLNRTGFNGLYRVNRAGRFNVPFGRYTNPVICDADNLRACAAVLAGVQLSVGDFASVAMMAEKGDFVYFDPPYVPVSRTASFTSYAANGFGLTEQERLADLVVELTRKGAYVMLSNSDTPEARKLYGKLKIERVLASRSINSNGARRGKVAEIVVRNYPCSQHEDNEEMSTGFAE